MTFLSLRPEHVDCWGREEALEYLCRQIFEKNRSATVVYGDSGIGKTTLLLELQKRITAPEVSVAYYECSRGATADPLLLCFDAFLDQTDWTLETLQDKIRLAVSAVRRNLKDFEQLKTFLGSVANSGLQSPLLPGVGKIAGVITKAISAAGEISSTRALMPSSLVPKLPPVVFRDMIELLHSAFPERRFVFILDNASADAEALATGHGTIRTLDSLASYLSTEFSRSKDIHFVLSWKDAPETHSALSTFAQQIREYGGNLYSLGPLLVESVSAWLETDFDWFRCASSSTREAVLKLCHGLPQVIDRWREDQVAELDYELLAKLADDVIERRYASLSADLAKSSDRECLYQLSLMPQILPLESLAALFAQSPQQTYDLLEAWTQKHLFNNHDSEFEFVHETRQLVTRTAVSSAMFDRGRAAARRLLDFYLENVGLPSDIHPLAPTYLAASSLVAEAAALSGDEEQVLVQVRAVCAGRDAPFPSIEQILRLPWNTRSVLLQKSYNRDVPNDTLESLETNVISDNEARKRSTLDFLLSLTLAVSRRAQSNDDPAYLRRLVAESLQILEELPDRREVAWIAALGFCNVACKYSTIGDLGALRSLTEVLENVLHRFGEDERIAEAAAYTFSNAVVTQSAAAFEIKHWLVILRVLSSKFPKNSAIAMLLAKGLAGSLRLQAECADALADLGLLQRAFPNDLEIRFWGIQALSRAVGIYADAQIFEEAIRCADDLRSLTEVAVTEVRASIEYATGLYNLFIALQRAEDMGRAEAIVPTIRSLYNQTRDLEIGRILAQALVNLVGIAGQDEDLAAVDLHLTSLRSLSQQTGRAPKVMIELANGLANAALANSGVRAWMATDHLVAELYSLLDIPSEGNELCEPIMYALAQLLPAYGAAQRWADVQNILTKGMSHLHTRTEDSAVRSWLATLLLNTSYVYGQAGKIAEVRAIADDLWSLYQKYPDDGQMAVATAKALANSVHAYREAESRADIAPALDRVVVLSTNQMLSKEGRQATARAFTYCVDSLLEHGEVEKTEHALDALQRLCAAAADDEALATIVSRCLRNAVLLVGQRQIGGIDGLIKRLRWLHQYVPHSVEVSKSLGLALSVGILALGDHGSKLDLHPYVSELMQISKDETVAGFLRDVGIVVVDDYTA